MSLGQRKNAWHLFGMWQRCWPHLTTIAPFVALGTYLALVNNNQFQHKSSVCQRPEFSFPAVISPLAKHIRFIPPLRSKASHMSLTCLASHMRWMQDAQQTVVCMTDVSQTKKDMTCACIGFHACCGEQTCIHSHAPHSPAAVLFCKRQAAHAKRYQGTTSRSISRVKVTRQAKLQINCVPIWPNEQLITTTAECIKHLFCHVT